MKNYIYGLNVKYHEITAIFPSLADYLITGKMTETKSIIKVLTGVKTSDEDFVALLDKILKICVIMSKKIDEIREELGELEGIIQIIIEGLDYKFWFKKNNHVIRHEQGINEHANLKIWISKNLLIKLLKQEITTSDAYMKGIITLKGSLTLAMHFNKYLLAFAKYLNAFGNNS